jgi:hypothetical protein
MDENKINELIDARLFRTLYNVSKVPFHVHNNIDSPYVPFVNVLNAPNAFCAAKTTTGTTAVLVFGERGLPYDITVTGVFVVSHDTTAATVALYNSTAIVSAIPKGTVDRAMVGGTLTADAFIKAGNPISVLSGTSGNATMFFTFTA